MSDTDSEIRLQWDKLTAEEQEAFIAYQKRRRPEARW
jgi:hypothetical protein